MNSKLHKNAVLSGSIDSFCLVCEYHLRGKQAVEDHVARAVHQKNLALSPYLDKFPGDCVRKVKKGYFCEFCNLLLPTATTVSLHITEHTHNNNKGAHLIQRVGSHIVISSNILITELAWNGITKDTCAVCNAEFLNLKLHIADQKHVLSLIQTKVEFGDVVFRKVDDTSFHCLICNMIFAMIVLEIHHNDDVHKFNTQKCQENYRKYFENNKDNVQTTTAEGRKSKTKATQKKKINGNVIPNLNEQGKATETMLNKSESTHNKQNIHKPKDTKTKQDTKENILYNNDVSQNECNKTDKNVNITNEKEQNLITKNANTKDKQDKGTSTNFTKTYCLQSQNDEKARSVKEPKMHTPSTNIMTTKTETMDTNCSQNFGQENLLEFVTDFQKDGVNINFETETAFCKKCFEDVVLDLKSIQKHIEEHKKKPANEKSNVVNTVDLNNCKTVLNSKDIERNQPDRPTIQKKYNLDQNHNETFASNSEEKEEIIKIDLRKNTCDNFEEFDSNSVLTPFIPGAAKAEAQIPKETVKPKSDEKLNDPEDMNNLKVFAEANKLTFNKDNKNAFCRICNIRVPACIRNMKEHVSGMSHKKKAGLAAKVENFIPKKPMRKFIYVTSTVTSVFGINDVILNDRFCLTRMSFLMITVQNRLRCQACEVNLTQDAVSRHVDSIFHERAMENTPVLCNLDTEFVREVRPNLYHCGYCNLIVGVYEDVAKHLKCSDHMSKKCNARSRLGEHLPKLLAHRQRDRFMWALHQHFDNFF